MTDTRKTVADWIAAGRQPVPLYLDRLASKAAPLAGLIDVGSVQPIHRSDQGTFDPLNRPDAVFRGLRASRTFNGTAHGETSSRTSPLGAPSVGGRVLPI